MSDPPAPAPSHVADAVRVDPVAAASAPLTESYCAAACSAAATQKCEKLAETCEYDTDGQKYVEVGGYMLHCKPACAAACVGHDTGRRLCEKQCLHGPDKPAAMPTTYHQEPGGYQYVPTQPDVSGDVGDGTGNWGPDSSGNDGSGYSGGGDTGSSGSD